MGNVREPVETLSSVRRTSDGGGSVREAGVNVGDAMSLIILLPGESAPTAVDLALVRWGKELCFGVEFVSMGSVEQDRLRQFLASASIEE